MTPADSSDAPPPWSVAIVLVGNELLSGKSRDENGAHALKALRAVGADVRRLEVVPDEEALIVDAVVRCRKLARQVITSGGIGTTHDDVTVPAICQALGRKLVHAPEIVELLRLRWGDDLHPYRIRLAEMPEGGEVYWGPDRQLVFPAIGCDGVLILPGVPELFREKLDALIERFRAPPIELVSLFLSCSEGEIAELLDQAARRFPDVAIGSYPKLKKTDHRVKVTMESREADRVRQCRAHLVDRLRTVMVREESTLPESGSSGA